MGEDYNNGIIPVNNLTFMKQYLYSKYRNFQPASIGYYLVNPCSSMNTFIEKGTGDSKELLYLCQNSCDSGYYTYKMNTSTSQFTLNDPLISYNVGTLDYWNMSMALFSQYPNTDEVMAPPYLTVVSYSKRS